MSSSYDKSVALAYQEQERSSSKQHRVLFHAYNLACYTGLLTTLFSAVGKTSISAGDIQTNAAFKCACLSAHGLSRRLKAILRQNISTSVYELWLATEQLLQSVKNAPIEKQLPDIPPLLHVAAIVIYDSLRSTLRSDVCTYREIVPAVALCNFAAKLSPSVDLHDGDKDMTVRNLTNILWSGAYH
jgi:hypothetical protein